MNVIWIVSDTLRRDHVGVYGNSVIHTLSMDVLAAKGVRLAFLRHSRESGSPCRGCHGDKKPAVYAMANKREGTF